MDKIVRYEKLFEPIRIGGVELGNRIIMPAMATNYASENGYVTEQLKAYYAERAGSAGLVVVEITCVDNPTGRSMARELAIDHDRYIPGLRELAAAIHEHGAKAFIQLHHAGGARKRSIAGGTPVSASGLVQPGCDNPREITTAEIADAVRRHAEAAGRAQKAGFDGVEVVASGGYLLFGFLSPVWNKRRDEYGGPLENRARLLLEVIRAVKGIVGETYPVSCRLCVHEYGIDGGVTPEESQRVAGMAQSAGLNMVDVTAFGYGADNTVLFPDAPGALVHLSESMKLAVTIPVVAVGGLNLELGERILEQGKADLISIGRGLISDPEFSTKALSGRPGDIRPCISCLSCVEQVLFKGGPLRCTVNPASGHESEYRFKVSPGRAKRVVVVGGGPAGMEAARVLRLRGHEVSLYEKEGSLGGQLNIAARLPHKIRIGPLVNYLAAQMDRTGVQVRLGTEFTLAMAESIRPDAVVVAAGAIPLTPDIRGLNRHNAVTAAEVLTGRAEVGRRCVIIGGELVGCETAEFLADRGRTVVVTRRGPKMAAHMNPLLRRPLMDRLRARGVSLLTGVRYDEATDKGVVVTMPDGETRTIEAETIVLAAGAVPNDDLVGKLRDTGPTVYAIGDCVAPRNIGEAMADGLRIGSLI